MKDVSGTAVSRRPEKGSDRDHSWSLNTEETASLMTGTKLYFNIVKAATRIYCQRLRNLGVIDRRGRPRPGRLLLLLPSTLSNRPGLAFEPPIDYETTKPP